MRDVVRDLDTGRTSWAAGRARCGVPPVPPACEVLDLQRVPGLLHGRRLAAEGRHEEATEYLLGAGAADEGAAIAEAAIVAAVERLDLALAERWLKTFEGSSVRDAPSFVTAELMLALAHGDPRRGVAVAER